MSDPVLVTATDGLTTITINRPEAMNALNAPAKVALRDALAEAAQDDSCRAILLAGAGERAFCVGQDLREHVENLKGEDPLATVRDHFNPIAELLWEMPKPVVAAVRGAAAGAGASLSFLADFRIGGPGTSFTMAFAGIGLTADTGASYTLQQLVGRAKALELLMLNDTVRAPEADRLGLLTTLVDDDEKVLATAVELATRLAAGPTVAYGQIKRSMGYTPTFGDNAEAELEAQRICGFTADHANAVDAFVNKRKPVFEGR